MRKNKKGFTLVEVIVAIAIVGIIAVGIIPAFAAQFKMTIGSRDITVKSFYAQGHIEEAMTELKSALTDKSVDAADLPDVTEVRKTIFGREVTLYRLYKTYPDNENKNYLVFLSKKLAQMEMSTLLVAKGVRIEVTGETVHDLADLKKSPKPMLEGKVDEFDESTNWYANVYKWYVSKEGDTDPIFPEDYERIIIPGVTLPKLTDLTKLANRYVIFSVTPVDIHGVRGNEITSSNRVYILGEEWRSGIFAWVDKNDDSAYKDVDDVMVAKKSDYVWHLLDGFDTAELFRDPSDPNKMLDPRDGSLFVPMGINRPPSSRNGPINVSGTNLVSWKVDKNINLATDIDVSNGNDITMETRDGNIIFYQFVELDSRTGNAKFDSKGKPILIDYGPSVKAATGSIELITSGRGDILFQDYTKLNAGKNIRLAPYGHITMYNNMLSAGDSIVLDSTKGAAFPGNRDILIRDTSLELKPGVKSGREISISSLNMITMTNAILNGNTNANSKVFISASDGADMSGVSITKSTVEFNSNARFRGGGWDSGSTVKVADGKTLSIGAGNSRVNNAGPFILGNTGGVSFINSMAGDIINPLIIALSKGSLDDQVTIATNYGRNLKYADSSGYQAAGYQRSLGSGQTNMTYGVEWVGGSGEASIACAYDGEDTISIKADTDESVSAYYRLFVEDRYADDVFGNIIFKVVSMGPGPATVTVLGSELPTYTVTFMTNDGTNRVHATITVSEGNSVNELPPAPVRFGSNFNGWNMSADGSGGIFTEGTPVNGNLTVYAQWTNKQIYEVTFNSNGGTPVNSIFVEQGLSIGDKMPDPPTKTGSVFSRWASRTNGGNTIDMNTIVNNNITAYAQWAMKPTFRVTFYRNHDSRDSNVVERVDVEQNTRIGDQLPDGPNRNGYSFAGWWTDRSRGQQINENTMINGDISAYARWTARKAFADINVGEYISINGKVFQKIHSNQLLLRETVGNRMSWDSANTRASGYKDQFSGVSWVTGSGMVDYTVLEGLNRNSILNIGVAWWGPSRTNNNAYLVNANGTLSNTNKSNSNYCRPRITVNAAGLYVNSGSGTSGNPYTLVKD